MFLRSLLVLRRAVAVLLLTIGVLWFYFFQSVQLDSPSSTISSALVKENDSAALVEPSRRHHNPFSPMRRTRRPCDWQTYTKGRWRLNRSMFPRFRSRGHVLGCCQRGYDQIHGAGARRPETMYFWDTTEHCELVPWDEQLFCSALRGRNIMFAGDSLNDHWHATLAYLLGVPHDVYATEGLGRSPCRTHAICGQYYRRPLKLFFVNNQFLSLKRCRGRNHKWLPKVSQYQILVLNSGSWMRDPCNELNEVSEKEYEQSMRKAAAALYAKRYNGTVVWRTTFQGHPYCWKYKEPLNDELPQESYPRVRPYRYYKWWEISLRNAFATAFWRDFGAMILDVTRATNLMPLGHLAQFHPKNNGRNNVSDCLHYCSPGAVYELWSQLLMNLLLGNLGE